jgi:hypothetical protein
MKSHHENRRPQFADTKAGRIRRDARRNVRAAKSAFLAS